MGKSRLVAEFVRDVRRGGPDRGVRRVPGVRDQDAVLRLARDLAPPVRPQGRRLDRAPDRRPAAAAGRDRSGARGAHAAPERRRRAVDPRLRPHAGLRRQAAQDVARGPARDLPARPGPEGAGRRRARGLPLDRRAVAGPPRASSSGRRRRCPCCSCWPTGPTTEPGGGLGVEGSAGFTELALDRMEPDDVAQLVRSKMQQLLGDEARRSATPSSSWSPRGPRATRSTSRSCSTSSSRRASTRPTRRRSRPSACRTACTRWC